MNLWKDTFIIEITHKTNTFHGEEIKYKEEFKGSLKGAMRYFINKYSKQHGYFVAEFYNSKKQWVKESFINKKMQRKLPLASFLLCFR